MKNHKVYINTDKCIGCSQCVKTCAAHNIELNDKKAEVLSDNCLMCGQCAAICPKEAVTISGYDSEAIQKKENFHLNPDDVLNVIKFRRTIRQFKDKEIPQNVIDQILEAGRFTHTAKNMQDVSFVVLDKKKEYFEQIAVRLFRKIKPFVNLINPMAKRVNIGENFFFFKAPVVIVVLAKEEKNGILAAQNMEFVAEANGLGVLFSGYFTTAVNFSHKIKRELRIPRGKKAVAALVLGYPNVKYLRSAQREKLDVVYM